jgi:hypothetical protein
VTLTLEALIEVADVFREYARAANNMEQTAISVEHVKNWGKPDVIQRRQDDLHRDTCIRNEKLALLDEKLNEYIDRKIDERLSKLDLSRRQLNDPHIDTTRQGFGPAF